MQEFSLNSLGGLMSTAAACIEDLLGKKRWEAVLKLEDYSRTWVMRGVDRKHSYGRLPNEHEIRPWAVPRSTGMLLHSLIRLLNCQSGLEIGTSLGYSAIFMGSALEATGGDLTTCEILAPKAAIAEQFLASADLGNVTVLKEDARRVSARWDRPLDFLFLDADPKNYISYMKSLDASLKRGALLVMDNALDHQFVTQPFIDFVLSSNSWRGHVVPLDHGLLLARRK
jgi:predicted O-methyltransferase YrrM